MPPKTITDEHKRAISDGRAQNAAIAAYLDALATPRRRGRPADPKALRKRLADTVKAIDAAESMVERLALVQERMNLEAALEAGTDADPVEATEPGFIEHAAAYSERKGVTWQAWRAIGVPAATLRAAGIERGR